MDFDPVRIHTHVQKAINENLIVEVSYSCRIRRFVESSDLHIMQYSAAVTATAVGVCMCVQLTARNAQSHVEHFLNFCSANAVRWPTRALQQEEEEQAVGTAEQHVQPPVIEVSGQSCRHLLLCTCTLLGS
jgi:hypothetical protein